MTSSEEKGDLEPYHNTIAWVNDKLLKGHNVKMPVQPAENIVNSFETTLALSKGATRFNRGIPYPESDHFHMNDTFGAVYLRAFLNKLIDCLPNK